MYVCMYLYEVGKIKKYQTTNYTIFYIFKECHINYF